MGVRRNSRTDGITAPVMVDLQHECVEDGDARTNYKHGSVSWETAENYRLHLQHLQEKIDRREPPFTPAKDGSIRLLKLPFRHGSAKAIVAAFETLSESLTPYVFIGQHDNFFVRDVHYLQNLIQYLESDETKPWLQCIHFPSTATLRYVQKIQRRYGIDLEQFCKRPRNTGGTFIPLVFWYGRSSLARTSYYTEKILREVPLKKGDHLEEVWGTRQLNSLIKVKESGGMNMVAFQEVHDRYGNYVYFESENDDEQREVLYHVSGRKARAASTHDESDCAVIAQTAVKSDSNMPFNPRDNSFTTARSAKAILPGLELGAPDAPKPRPLKKFRNRCFHCGERGKCLHLGSCSLANLY